jgi:O-antigen ligase
MLAAGAVTAVIGALSLFTDPVDGLRRAAPLSFFGLWPLGMNHNLLAETLVATVPIAIVSALFSRGRKRRLFSALSAAMAIVGLLTFARTAWIAFAFMALAAGFTEYRIAIRKRWRTSALVLLLLLPLVFVLIRFSGTREVAGSTASRLALTEFSLYLFSTHPLLGAGAGTFVPRIAQARGFLQDFGDPIDAHGFGQKILAEQGIVGIVFFLFLLGRITQTLAAGVRAAPAGSPERSALLLLSLAAVGMIVYELFNTTYYSAKLWLPIGAALAAVPVLTREKAPIL